jgi:MtN3 and saliva related transmembrane protein
MTHALAIIDPAPHKKRKLRMFVDTNHLGYLAATCTTGAFIPQVLMVWRQRGAPGVSTGMYLLFILGIVLWFLYGLALEAWPVVIANGLTLLLASAILAMKWHFERPPRA